MKPCGSGKASWLRSSERVLKLCGAPRQTPHHEPDHGELQPCFTRLDLALVILAQSALPPHPSPRAFDNPAPGSDDKPLDVGRARDDLHTPGAFGRTPGGERLTAMGAISPDELQTGLQRLDGYQPHTSENPR